MKKGKAAPFCNVSRHSWLVGASKEGRERLGYTKSQTPSTRRRGPSWRIHGSVEDTKLSTNKQHSVSGDSSLYSSKAISFLVKMKPSKSAIIAERFAYIKGQVLGVAKPSGPGSSAIEDAKIEMALDLDWRMRSDSLFSSTTSDACASPARSPTDRSRSTSPLFRSYQRTSGQTSPNDSFKTSKAHLSR